MTSIPLFTGLVGQEPDINRSELPLASARHTSTFSLRTSLCSPQALRPTLAFFLLNRKAKL